MRIIPRRKKKLNQVKFAEQWQDLQKLCGTRKTWPQAIFEADKLVDDALKRLKYKGKTTGERLVAAQHDLTSNDMIWFGHKLRNKLEQDDIDVRTLKKQDIIDALNGFRQALRDLGALEARRDK
jgi:hypothetical protein